MHIKKSKTDPDELANLARPLVAYLRKNYHPHAAIVVMDEWAVVVEEVMGIPVPLGPTWPESETGSSSLSLTGQMLSLKLSPKERARATSDAQVWAMLNKKGKRAKKTRWLRKLWHEKLGDNQRTAVVVGVMAGGYWLIRESVRCLAHFLRGRSWEKKNSAKRR